MFKLEFTTDNTVFEEDGTLETKRILERLLKQLDGGMTDGMVYDTNGNRIGQWSLEYES